jgi:phosphatidylserine decarboxylase
VRPIALEASPVFCENCREYTVIDTDDFGLVTQIEVGALLVGKIANLHGARRVERGEEKGMFLYGGSTVVLLLERDKLDIDNEFFAATERGEETPVVMGQALGRRKR